MNNSLHPTPSVEDLMSLSQEDLATLRRRTEDVLRKKESILITTVMMAITTGSIKYSDILSQ